MCGDYNTVLSSRLNRLDFLYGCDRKIEGFSPTAWVVLTADWRQTWSWALKKVPDPKEILQEIVFLSVT